jgi:hypothetical protein
MTVENTEEEREEKRIIFYLFQKSCVKCKVLCVMPDQFFMKSYLSLPEIFGVQTDKPGVKTYTSINAI